MCWHGNSPLLAHFSLVQLSVRVCVPGQPGMCVWLCIHMCNTASSGAEAGPVPCSFLQVHGPKTRQCLFAQHAPACCACLIVLTTTLLNHDDMCHVCLCMCLVAVDVTQTFFEQVQTSSTDYRSGPCRVRAACTAPFANRVPHAHVQPNGRPGQSVVVREDFLWKVQKVTLALLLHDSGGT